MTEPRDDQHLLAELNNYLTDYTQAPPPVHFEGITVNRLAKYHRRPAWTLLGISGVLVAAGASAGLVLAAHNSPPVAHGAPAGPSATSSATPTTSARPILTQTPPIPATPSPPSSGDLQTVAETVMSPRGRICDTYRFPAASDVNRCPYTTRLKLKINALYVLARTGVGNPNPILIPGMQCVDEVVNYDVAISGAGGTVGLVEDCPGSSKSPAYVLHKLVIVRSGSALLVDDILDGTPRQDGTAGPPYTSIYSR